MKVGDGRQVVTVRCFGCPATAATVTLRSGGHLVPIQWYRIHGRDWCEICGPQELRRELDANRRSDP
jgi:hypothetical protein